MKAKSLLNKFFSKGFTLIELLIVIAILGILAASVLVAINPVKRINQAKDSTIKSDIAQIATAMQTYFTAKGTLGTASYPAAVADLVSALELKSEPKLPGGSSYSVAKDPGTCTTVDANCTNVAVYATLNETSTKVWCWKSSTGVAAEIPTASCTAAP